MPDIKNQILNFVRDHWEHFGAYPMEVETEKEVLKWDQYWSYITEKELRMTKTPQIKPDWKTGIYIGNGVVAIPKPKPRPEKK